MIIKHIKTTPNLDEVKKYMDLNDNLFRYKRQVLKGLGFFALNPIIASLYLGVNLITDLKYDYFSTQGMKFDSETSSVSSFEVYHIYQKRNFRNMFQNSGPIAAGVALYSSLVTGVAAQIEFLEKFGKGANLEDYLLNPYAIEFGSNLIKEASKILG